jgi:outer membrane receptor protein involved in Fe transport
MARSNGCAKCFLVFMCLFLLGGLRLQAQLTEGSIGGTVTDVSGAAIADAKVLITNLETGSSVQPATDNIGYFRATHLAPGNYQVRVEKAGFKTALVDRVAVNVNAIARVDVKLQPGKVQETITVTAETPLVQTEEGRLSNTLTTRDVTDLPLNGRQVYQLVTLEPGVTATNAPVVSNVASPTSSNTFDFGYIANGSTPRGNNFILDGNSNNNEWLGGTPLIFPSIDAIEEVQVQTLNFSAEYGRNDGAIVNIVTKSGGNGYHGTTFYTGRNTALNARNYFDVVAKTPLQQNQFGFAFGGPIIKNKTFFFVDYEGSRLKDGAPAKFTVETPDFRDFVTTNLPNSFAAQFYRDFPAPPCVADVVHTGGYIPDPTSGPIVVFPAAPPNPNVPDQSTLLDQCTTVSSQIARNQADQYSVRIDQHLTKRDQLYGRWVATKASGDVARDELGGANIRGFTSPQDGFFADLGLGYTHEFTSTILNDFRFAYSRNNSNMSFGMPASTQTAQALQGAGFPLSRFGSLFFDDGTTQIGGEVFNPRVFVFNTFAFNDILTVTAGRHTVKIGFEARHIQENSDYQLLTNPFYEFTSKFYFANDAPYLIAATVGRNPDGTNFGDFTNTPRHFRWSQWAGFVQDDWKVSHNVTLNLGLRYSVFGSPSETNGLLNNIILGSGYDFQAKMASGTVGRVKQMWKTDLNDFAPRIGLAWDPTGKGTTAIRSGFGIAYNEPFSNLWSNGSRFDPPDTARVVEDPVFFVGTDINYTFPFQTSPDFAALPPRANGGVPGLNITLYGTDPQLRTAYAEQWFLGVQHQFLRDYGFSVNYVGTHGVKGYTREDYNRFAGDVCNAVTCDFNIDRLNPGWGSQFYTSNESSSIYHGLNAQLRKTYAHGFTWTANYTFGKVLDNVTEGNLGDYFNVNAYSAAYTGVQDIDNPGADRGPSEFDVRHRFTLSALWDLPFFKSGRGSRFLGGWQLNTIVALQSGRPFDVDCSLAWFQGCDFNMDGVQTDRPNKPAGVRTSGFSNQDFVNGALSLQAFCPDGLVPFFVGTPCVPVGTDGNLARNAFRGPSFKSVDLGLFKNTKIRENLNIQFRAEAFNLFNRVNLFNPVGDLGSPQFGKSVAAFAPREIQLGLKVVF